MAKKIFTIGSATKDIFLQGGQETASHVECHNNASYICFEEGKKINIPALHYAMGGGSINTSVSFHRQGLHVTSCFKTGNDSQATFIRRHLEQIGIGDIHQSIAHHDQTGISCILPTPSGNRVILAYRGANATIVREDLPASLTSYDAAYIAPLSDRSAETIVYLFTNTQVPPLIALNPGIYQLQRASMFLEPLLPFITLFIVNAAEARILAKSLVKQANPHFLSRKSDKKQPQLFTELYEDGNRTVTIFDYFAALLAKGPSIAVVTNGAEGVYAATQNTYYFHPSITDQSFGTLRHTVGAGDAFGSTFFASILQGKGIENALIRSIISSTRVMQHHDATEGLPTSQQLDTYLIDYGIQRVQKIDY